MNPGRVADSQVAGVQSTDIHTAVNVVGMHRRGLIDTLLDRSRYLAAPEAALVRAVYGHGLSITSTATAGGRQPRVIRIRLRRLVRRMCDPIFVFVLRERAAWPDDRRAVAEACLLRGLGLRRAAASTGLSLHTVRRERAEVRRLFECERAGHQRRTVATVNDTAGARP